MKRLLLLICLIPIALTGCLESIPIRFSASYEVEAKGLEQPIRLEVGYGNVTMSGKEAAPVQP